MNNEESKKILGADYLDNSEYNVNLDPAEEGNPRLKINIPANKGFFEITQTDPPYIVVVARADQEINAMGILEKAKWVVLSFQTKISKKLNLTRGVTMDQVKSLLGGKNGK